jgi:hypothetical protein
MKKLAIGCGIVLVLAAVAGGVGAYYVFHKVKSTVSQFTALGSIPDIEREVRDTSPFTPPDSGEFTDAQLSQLIAVQDAVRSKLGARFKELDAKYKTLSARLKEHDATPLDAPAIIGAYRDLASAYLDAKRWQVEALNAQHLSLPQYRWIRRQAYAAMGVPVMDVDIGAIITDVKAGRTPETHKMDVPVGPSGPKRNQERVEAHRKTLENNAALAFLGL